jgi:2',3'-cyclic-nucleotide 2'-phosphodiesterase (5'-nucleotidase family)
MAKLSAPVHGRHARTSLVVLLLFLTAVSAWYGFASAQPQPSASTGERRITFITVNDIYRIDGVSEGKVGGLTRLRTLRKWIEQDAPNAVLLHAGDFLSPSLISRVFKGEQMVDAMNHLDGDGPGFDHRLLVVLGNHEFDESQCNKHPAPLIRRIEESKFIWLAGNLEFSDCASMQGLPSLRNVRKDGIILEIEGIKIGIFGIAQTPDEEGAPKYPDFGNPLATARRSIEYLRRGGAEFIVALTHLRREDDEALLREFASNGIDLLVGGHEHSSMVLKDDAQHARGFKADSDGRTAWRIDVHLGGESRPRIEARLIALNEAIPPDIAMSKLANDWLARASRTICEKRAQTTGETPSADCLMQPIGRTQTMIELEEIANRSQQTGFGNWLADLVLEKTGADVAILNSGMLGLNDDLAPDTPLLVKHVIDIFRYDDVVAVRAFPAKVVCEALRHGFARPGSGAWPHVGGVRVAIKRVEDEGNVAVVRGFLKRPEVTCDSEAEIKVASVPFLLCGGDRYPLKAANLNPQQSCEDSIRSNPQGTDRPGTLLGRLAEAEVRRLGETGISPKKDDRLTEIPGSP